MRNARTGEQGNYGDGRIFISAVTDAYTISTGKQGL
jgi:nitrogen regulatory protein PII 1